MRLICPNCGAQYEVADDVIPPEGRDVQCSNCAHTWFEEPGASEAAEAIAQGNAPEDAAPAADPEPTPEPPAPEPEPEPEPDLIHGADHAPTEAAEAYAEADTWPDAHSPDQEDGPQPEPQQEPAQEPGPEPVRRELDPDIADILREEAAREQEARASEAQPMETQPDLGLDEGTSEPSQEPTPPVDPGEDRRSREARERLARLRGEEAATTAVAATIRDADMPRRELLPDIEEINSTLRPDAGPGEAAAIQEGAAPRRSGFARGFISVVVLALIALALYVFAPQISAAVPQAEPALTAYVNWVNDIRLWLDQQVQGLIESATEGGAAQDAPAEGS